MEGNLSMVYLRKLEFFLHMIHLRPLGAELGKVVRSFFFGIYEGKKKCF